MMEQYEHLAQVYDSFMYDTSYADWADYLAELLGEGVHSLLEYGCGTGSLTLELLRRGYEVCAVDISEHMLDIAAGKLRVEAFAPRLACADMAEFRLQRPVNAAVCACDGVNYLLSGGKLNAFFAGVYANLKQGGMFLFDISSAHKLEAVLGDEFFYDDADDGTLFWQNTYDAAKRQVTMDISLFVPDGEVYHRYEERHVQRAWGVEEIKEALTEAGFRNVRAMCFGTREPAGDTDERIQFTANKGE